MSVRNDVCTATRSRTWVIDFLGTTLVASLILAPAAAQPISELRAPPCRLIVLDDCDPDYQGKKTYEDNVTFLDGQGRLRARISGLNICQEIGSPHRIAVDSKRQRVWLAETVGRRLLQYDLGGAEIKQVGAIPDVKASGLAVDPATGNIWVARSEGRIDTGATDVYDATGKRLASYDVRGWDIAYDPVSKAFWLAGRQLVKLSRDGKVLSQQQIAQWTAVSVAVDAKTGNVWVAVREHSAGLGRNELLGFDKDGKPRHTIPLGKRIPFRVAIDSRSGAVWVTNMRNSILRYSVDGKLEREIKLPALTAEVDSTTGNVWVVTSEETLQINSEGKELWRTKHKAKTSQAWICGYERYPD